MQNCGENYVSLKIWLAPKILRPKHDDALASARLAPFFICYSGWIAACHAPGILIYSPCFRPMYTVRYVCILKVEFEKSSPVKQPICPLEDFQSDKRISFISFCLFFISRSHFYSPYHLKFIIIVSLLSIAQHCSAFLSTLSIVQHLRCN